MWWHRIAFYIRSHTRIQLWLPAPLAHSKRTIYDVVFVLFTIVWHSRQFSYYVCYYYCRVFWLSFLCVHRLSVLCSIRYAHTRTLRLLVRRDAAIIGRQAWSQPNETINWTFCNKDESAYSNSERDVFFFHPLPTILSMFVNWQSTNWHACVSLETSPEEPKFLAGAQTCTRNFVATSRIGFDFNWCGTSRSHHSIKQ